MKLLGKAKLKLVAKTLMDFAKVVLVASGLFSVAVPGRIRLLGLGVLVILFAGGWVLYPNDEESKNARDDV